MSKNKDLGSTLRFHFRGSLYNASLTDDGYVLLAKNDESDPVWVHKDAWDIISTWIGRQTAIQSRNHD